MLPGRPSWSAGECGVRVLVVEGFAVDVAGDGVEGLWLAREHPYDVLVLDIMLPGMSGYQVCATLRAERNWTPILMLTAKDGEWDEVDGLDTGADDYLTKPFDTTTLTTADDLLSTFDYLAPERIRDDTGGTPATDVYALACVLFQCLTGRVPFPAADAEGKLTALLGDRPPAPSLFDSRIPPALDRVVRTGYAQESAATLPDGKRCALGSVRRHHRASWQLGQRHERALVWHSRWSEMRSTTRWRNHERVV
jgi:CheY-like chemotaxis protein